MKERKKRSDEVVLHRSETAAGSGAGAPGEDSEGQKGPACGARGTRHAAQSRTLKRDAEREQPGEATDESPREMSSMDDQPGQTRGC